MSNEQAVEGATPEIPTTPPPAAAPATDPKPTETVEFWKQQARENEKRAKANAEAVKELDKLKAASMTELERAVNEAKASSRVEVLREVGADRARDAVRVALAGRTVDVDALLEGFGADAFVNDDGTPNVAKVQEWANRIAPATDAPGKPRVPAGVRDNGSPKADPAKEFADFLDGQLKRS